MLINNNEVPFPRQIISDLANRRRTNAVWSDDRELLSELNKSFDAQRSQIFALKEKLKATEGIYANAVSRHRSEIAARRVIHADEVQQLKEDLAQARITAQAERDRAEDAMVAHNWFAEQFGEVMNGRDFRTKCLMASRELEYIQLRDAKDKDWAYAEKHSAQADAEREKNRADTALLRVAELESRPAKCLFCEFRGTFNDLTLHSASCANHPLAARIAELENTLLNRDELMAGKSLTIRQGWQRIEELEARLRRATDLVWFARYSLRSINAITKEELTALNQPGAVARLDTYYEHQKRLAELEANLATVTTERDRLRVALEQIVACDRGRSKTWPEIDEIVREAQRRSR